MPVRMNTTPIRFPPANFTGQRISLFDPGGPKVIFEFGTIDGLRIREFRLDALNYIRKIARNIRKAFQQTTRTFKHKPTFGIKTIAARDTDWGAEVGTNDLNYFRINEGTKKSRRPSGGIRLSRRAGGGISIRKLFIAFQEFFLPKTKPWIGGRFIASPGSRSGRWIYKTSVMNGIKPRNFVGYAASEGGKLMDQTLNKFMTDALQHLIAVGAGNIKIRGNVDVTGMGSITSIER